MNYLHIKHRKLSEVIAVPDGLRELMADITREVLRYQPENIEVFIADYLEAMLLTREVYSVANQTIEDVLESSLQIVELLQRDGITLKQAESAVEVMREEFHSNAQCASEENPIKELNIINRLVSECVLSVDQAKAASGVIEDAWCHFYELNKVKNKSPIIHPDLARSEAVKNTLSIYQKSKASRSDMNMAEKNLGIGFKGYFDRKSRQHDERESQLSFKNWRTPNFQERETAAKKIQAWYRRCRVRNRFLKIVETKAATVIQARFRGYHVRKEYKQKREKAAIKIQSYYRAYRFRQQYKIIQNAAVMIQAAARGFLVRKQLKK